jgi:pimeloyl-ACP methyl ester carboxylesterase
LLARALPALGFDASACPGAGAVSFDTTHLALMGHSMGAWIAPITLAWEPLYGAAVLSGAGGSYIANVMDKIKPLHVRPLAEILLDYNMDGRSLDAHDPALTLVQWAAEPSDPQVYARQIITQPVAGAAPRHVLMLQGIVDHYILPSIANATSLSLGLDQAGPARDADDPEEQMLGQVALGVRLPLIGRTQIALPVSGNLGGGAVTGVVVQHTADGLEDGHEVMFQTEPPKHQYRCFLSSFKLGVPTVPADGAADAPCP